MTYQHALQYLTAEPTNAVCLPINELRPLVGSHPTIPLLICFSHDKQASAAALFLRAVLVEAGIGCLHVIDAPTNEMRDRFILDGRPIPPPALCPHAHAIRAREIVLRRSASTKGTDFPMHERTAAVLLRCTAEQKSSVILLESNTPHLLHAFGAFGKPTVITAVSATDVGGHTAVTAITPATTEVISHACGAAVIRALSDACAQQGSRLIVIPRTDIRRRALTLGSQIVDCPLLSDCHLRSGSGLVLDAAVLALQLVALLRRSGLTLSDDHLRRGLAKVTLPNCLTPVSIHPLLIAERVENEAELSATLRDLADLGNTLPRPLHIRCEPSLFSTLSAAPELYDTLSVASDDSTLSDDRTDRTDRTDNPDGTTLMIGSAAFLNEFLIEWTKTPKKI